MVSSFAIERENIFMENNGNSSTDQTSEKQNNTKKQHWWEKAWVIGIGGTIIGGLAVFVGSGMLTNTFELPTRVTYAERDIETIQTDVSSIQKSITTIESEISSINTKIQSTPPAVDNSKFDERLSTLGNSIGNLETVVSEMHSDIKVLQSQTEILFNSLQLRPSTLVQQTISVGYCRANNDNESVIATDGPVLAPVKIFALDRNNTEYTKEQLSDLDLVLSYSDSYYNVDAEKVETQDVYFYGQYDENNCWDGHCIVNIYDSQGKLYLITDAEYDGGELLSYYQIFPSKSASGSKIWSFADRVVDGKVSKGITLQFVRTEDYYRNFETPIRSDILSAKDFISKNIFGRLHAYYYGDVSDGYFNDSSGNADMIIFNSDETVFTLYVGNFKNGTFEDDTGNAWLIGNSGEGTDYYYHKGVFAGGRQTGSGQIKLSIEEINEIIGDTDLHYSASLLDDLFEGTDIHLPESLLWESPAE